MWIRFKRLLLATLIVVMSLPVVGVFIPSPVYATSNNWTAAGSYCIDYSTNTTILWEHSGTNYVGCVNACNTTRYGLAMGFLAVTIPKYSTINSAYFIVTSNGNYALDTVNSIIQGEDADTAIVPAGVVDYQGRVRTSAYTSWNGISHWTIGSNYTSSDISTVVSEIVNRPAWAGGNNMVLFWDDHNAASSQSCFMLPIVRGGNTFRLFVDYTAPVAPVVPTIITKDATDVGSTSAVLNAYIENDGGDLNGVAVRFGYANVTHAANFAAYTPNISAWSTGNYSTGEVPMLAFATLTPSTTYYFNVQGQNSAGTATGTEQTFVTPASTATLSPSNFILLPSSTSIDMQWSKPSGFSVSILRFKEGSIPVDNITGTLLYQGTNGYLTHSGLTSGKTYGYRLWGYEGGLWSASTTGIVTTKGTSTGAGLTTPSEPLNWFITTDYTTMNRTFFFPIVNNIADSLSMPRDTAWVTWALGVSMFLGFLVWSASRSMVALTIAVCIGITIGWAQHLIPMYMAFLVFVFGISIIAVRERI